MDEFLERMAMLLVVRNEQSNRIAPVHEFFAHVGEAEEIRGALARSERLQDFFDLAVEHFARGIELRLRQLAEREKTQPQRPRDGSTAVASSDLVAHRLAGAFIGFLNSWLRNGRPRESGGHAVAQIRLGRNNKCRVQQKSTYFLKNE